MHPAMLKCLRSAWLPIYEKERPRMGLGFTTSGRLDEHNRVDNARSRKHIHASGDVKPRLPPTGKNR